MAATTALVAGTVAAGAMSASATRKAAKTQAQSGEQGIQFQREALSQVRGDLAPFRAAGEAALNPLQNLIINPQAQSDFLNNNPILQAANDETARVVMSNQAARGKLGSGGTLEELQKRFLANSLPILNQQQGQLFNLAALGQNAAAQQGTATQNTANNITNLTTDIGAARAAGQVGQANAINNTMAGLARIYGMQ